MFSQDAGLVAGLENPPGMGPEVHAALPNIASGWQYTDGGKTLTLFLRPGPKWSDGVPFNTEDWLFWYRSAYLNQDLTPIIAARMKGLVLTAPEPNTPRFTFPQPYPFLIQEIAQIISHECVTRVRFVPGVAIRTDKQKLSRMFSR